MISDLRNPERYPLDDIVARIWEDLGVIPIEQATDGDGAATWHKGAAALYANNRRPPSYVWFRGDIDPDAPFKGDFGRYKAVHGGGETVFVHCWGGSEPAAWAMQHNLVASARKLYGPDCRWRGSRWYEPDENGRGAGFVVTLQFAVPVIGVQHLVAVPTDVQNQAFLRINGVDIPATGA